MIAISILLLLLFPTSSLADRDPAFTNPRESRCQARIGKSAADLLQKSLLAWERCYEKERSQQIPCYSIHTEADIQVLQNEIDQRCQLLESETEFPIIGLGSFPESLTRIVEVVEETATTITQIIHANNTANIGDNAYSKCLKSINKQFRKLIKKQANINLRKCIDRNDKQQASNPSLLPHCNESKRRLKHTALLQKTTKAIDKKCSTTHIETILGSISDSTRNLLSELVEIGRLGICELYPNAGNFDICPAIRLRNLESTHSAGWNGIGHGDMQGESSAKTIHLHHCDDNSPQNCLLFRRQSGEHFDVSPRLTTGSPSCAVSRATDHLQGSITFFGKVESILNLEITEPRALEIYLGINFDTPCPVCTGAGLNQKGICIGGRSDGNQCVVHKVDLALGNVSNNCLPSLELRIDETSYSAEATKLNTHLRSLESSTLCNLFPQFSCHCPGQTAPNSCSSLGTCDANSEICANNGNHCFDNTITRSGSTQDLTLVAVGCNFPGIGPAGATIGLPGPYATERRVEVTAF